MKRRVTVIVMAAMAVGVGVGWGAHQGDGGKEKVRIEEDQPGWDCRTMGNRVCGPITVVGR